MNIEMTEHNLSRNLAYQKFPEYVATIRRSNVVTMAKELHDIGALSNTKYENLLVKLLKAEGIEV